MNTVLKSLSVPLIVASFREVIRQILASLNDSRFLIHTTSKAPMGNGAHLQVRQQASAYNVQVIQPLEVIATIAGRYEVRLPGVAGDAGNLRKLTGSSYKTFSGLGEVVEVINNGSDYELPIIAGGSVPTVYHTELLLQDQGDGSYTDTNPLETLVLHSSDGDGTLYGDVINLNLNRDDLFAALLAIPQILSVVVGDGGYYNVTHVEGTAFRDDLFIADGVNLLFTSTVGSNTPQGVVNGIMVDQISGTTALVNVSNWTGTNPTAGTDNLIADFEFSSQTRSLFE